MNEAELKEFGIEYETAWRSLDPERPFSFQTENCKVTVNDGEPMISPEERLNGINSLVEAFPDLLVTMKEIVEEGNGTVFYWNRKGTNTGPGGTGNKLDIDGCEIWKLDNNNKITKLDGYFDTEEFERQINKEEFKPDLFTVSELALPSAADARRYVFSLNFSSFKNSTNGP